MKYPMFCLYPIVGFPSSIKILLAGFNQYLERDFLCVRYRDQIFHMAIRQRKEIVFGIHVLT